MRIEWLNEECTKARLVRRAWPRFWVKLETYVECKGKEPHDWDNLAVWYYSGTNVRVPGEFDDQHRRQWDGLQSTLNCRARDELDYRKARDREYGHASKWSKVGGKIPTARLVKGK